MAGTASTLRISLDKHSVITYRGIASSFQCRSKAQKQRAVVELFQLLENQVHRIKIVIAPVFAPYRYAVPPGDVGSPVCRRPLEAVRELLLVQPPGRGGRITQAGGYRRDPLRLSRMRLTIRSITTPRSAASSTRALRSRRQVVRDRRLPSSRPHADACEQLRWLFYPFIQ